MCCVVAGVRLAAAESLPFLIDCARIKGQDYLNGVWLFMLRPLLQCIETEPEADIKAENMHSLALVTPHSPGFLKP